MRLHNRHRLTGLTLLAGLLASACSGSAGDPSGASDAWHEGTLRTASGDVAIQYEIKNGVPLMEGDIALRRSEIEGSLDTDSFTMGARNTVFAAGGIWPSNTVPYRFDVSVTATDQLRTLVPQAAAHYALMTPVSFVFDATNSAPDYILFKTNTGTGCNSLVGHTSGEHDVNLDTGCKTFDVVVHEMGHTVGLQHEQSRPDRASYITVQTANILPARLPQFNIQSGAAVGPFDFTSVMLYPSSTSDPTFAVNTSKPIITKLDGTAYPNPQTGKGLSDGDVAGVLTLYPFGSTPPPAITAISPSSGPNIGGTQVTITGARFDTTGKTQFMLGSYAATNVSCSTTRKCVATVPAISYESTALALDIHAVVGGLTSYPSASDVFTYTAGPNCTSSLSCQGIAFGFPDSIAVCPTNVDFFQLFATSSQSEVGSGTTFTYSTNDVGLEAAACDPTTGSCTTINTYEASSTYCGAVPPPEPPPSTCDGAKKPVTKCAAGWRCCGTDGWSCGVCQ